MSRKAVAKKTPAKKAAARKAATRRSKPEVRVKRVYDAPEASDGRRLLVDRLWPRGLSKDKAKLDDWLRDIAPSSELRKWYHADMTRFAEFRRRYLEELKPHAEAIAALRAAARKGIVTLLTASANIGETHADVLRELLKK